MPSQAGTSAAAAPSRSSGKAWLLVAAVLALGGGGIGASRGMRAPRTSGAESAAKAQPVREQSVVHVDPFILNLADPTGDRYFRLNLRLVLDQRTVAERAAGGLAQVKLRDRILSLLAKKKASQLTSVEGKERLRTELVAATEPLLAEAPFHDPEHDAAPARVLDVLFTEFLVQ